MELQGKVAIVTGATGGIGKASAQALAQKGASVALIVRSPSSGEALVKEFAAQGFQARFFLADLGSRDQCTAAVAAALESYGRLDCLATCHAYDVLAKPFLEGLEEEWERMIAVNFLGTLHIIRAVLPAMIQQGGGRIVNVTSDAAKIGLGGAAVCSATKGAVSVFSKSLAREVARHNICVNCVCPGPTETPGMRANFEGPNGQKILESMTRGIPLRRLAKPEEIAAMVAFLATDAAGFVTGQLISVNGGLTMA